MAEIVLATLNARYWHSAFGLRYLLANMGPLRDATAMIEFGIHDSSVEMLAAILDQRPRIVGIGVYIWNVEPATRLVADLKRVAPDTVVVLGGPEVSYESAQQPIVQLADYVITGEADLAFPELCQQILGGSRPAAGVIPAGVPPLDRVRLPYDLYTKCDVAERVIYVEASRGCPFTCEFCLSSLEIPVRQFPLDEFLAAMQRLLDQGAKQFKFVDRTFNLNLRISRAILEFFLQRYQPGLFLHFEMIPDRLPDALRELISRFPPGVLQFEIGVQTFDDAVGERISRRQDNEKLAQNFRFLRQQTGVHIHADLIVGLPGETVESFASGFDRLIQLDPQEIQVGILKRLRGTPIVRHDAAWQMVYSDHPPYEILSNRLIDFATMHRLRRFARFWDLIGNSGNFVETRPLIWRDADSPFQEFLLLSDWLFEVQGRGHAIALAKLAEHLFRYLVEQRGLPAEHVARSIWNDYIRGGRRDGPAFLRSFNLPQPSRASRMAAADPLPARQARHAAQASGVL